MSREEKKRTKKIQSAAETPASNSSLSSVADMPSELSEIKARVVKLEEKLEYLEASNGAEKEVIVLRTIDRDQAKQEILDLFESGETFYFSDIVERLRLDLPVVTELCRELIKEGELEVDADAVRRG